MCRGEFSPVNVYGVAEGLERVETDAYRQNNLQSVDFQGLPEQPEGSNKVFYEEIKILKIGQQPDINQYADHEPGLTMTFFCGFVEFFAYQVVDHRAERNKG